MDYYLRCKETDYPNLVTLGKTLGVIRELEGKIIPVWLGDWDYIGYIYDPLTGTEQTNADGERYKVGQTPYWKDGVPYVHINFRTEHNIRELAEALAIENPAIAWALSTIPNYFITDANGNHVAPSNPVRVFA